MYSTASVLVYKLNVIITHLDIIIVGLGVMIALLLKKK